MTQVLDRSTNTVAPAVDTYMTSHVPGARFVDVGGTALYTRSEAAQLSTVALVEQFAAELSRQGVDDDSPRGALFSSEGHVGDARLVPPGQLRLRGRGVRAWTEAQGLDARRRRHGQRRRAKADADDAAHPPGAVPGVRRQGDVLKAIDEENRPLLTPSSPRASTARSRRATAAAATSARRSTSRTRRSSTRRAASSPSPNYAAPSPASERAGAPWIAY